MELLMTTFEFTTDIIANVSVCMYDILNQLDRDQKLALLQEIREELNNEIDDEESDFIDKGGPTMEEAAKKQYLDHASKFYSLEEVKQRLPEKLGW